MDMTENFGYGNGYDKSWIFRIYIHILYPKMQLDIYPPNISGLWIYILDIYPKDIYPTQSWFLPASSRSRSMNDRCISAAAAGDQVGKGVENIKI